MTAKKRSGKQEPLLNTVARKLGHAAGTLTKATHKLTEIFRRSGDGRDAGAESFRRCHAG